MPKRNQPNLFDDVGALPPPSPDLVALGARVPPNVRFGTSTWTYDGWMGEVYHRTYRSAQPARRLEEYVRYPLFRTRSEEHTSELQSHSDLVCRLLLEKKKKNKKNKIKSKKHKM